MKKLMGKIVLCRYGNRSHFVCYNDDRLIIARNTDNTVISYDYDCDLEKEIEGVIFYTEDDIPLSSYTYQTMAVVPSDDYTWLLGGDIVSADEQFKFIFRIEESRTRVCQLVNGSPSTVDIINSDEEDSAEKEILRKYFRNKKYFYPHQTDAIERLIERARNTNPIVSDNIWDNIARYIDIFQAPISCHFTSEEISNQLKSQIYGQDNLVDKLSDAVSNTVHTNRLFLFNGVYRKCGRHHIAKSLADVLSRPIVNIDISGCESNEDLYGIPYENFPFCKFGLIFEAIAAVGTTECIVVIDNFDYSFYTSAYEVNDFCEEDGMNFIKAIKSKYFVDKYMDAPLDLSNTIFIFIPSDHTGFSIPADVRRQFDQILTVSRYNAESLTKIANEWLIPSLLDKYFPEYYDCDKDFVVDGTALEEMLNKMEHMPAVPCLLKVELMMRIKELFQDYYGLK